MTATRTPARLPPAAARSETPCIAARSPDLQGAEREHRAHQPEDPEADHDLRLRPPHLLEVVVDRSHPEDPAPFAVAAPGVLEPAGLQDHRERLRDENAPHDHEQEIG